MNRSLTIYATVLAASLLAAYLVWTREPDSGKEDETTILSFRKLDRVLFEEPKKKVSIEQKRDAHGSYHWVRIETQKPAPSKPKAPAPPKGEEDSKAGKGADDKGAATAESKGETKGPDDGEADTTQAKATSKDSDKAPASAPTEPSVITELKNFVANQTAQELFDKLKQLPAARVLGKLGQEKLDEFGLSESDTSFTIVSGSTTRRFRVGDRTYGNLDYYLQDTADERVFVVRQDLVDQVKNARSRLYTANLHDFTLADVEHVVISQGEQSLTLWQHDREKSGAAYWTSEKNPESKQGDDSYRNWIGKVDALRVKEYSLPSDKPADLNPIARVDYFDGAKKLGFVTLFETGSAPILGKPTPNEGGKTYYAESEHTRVPVEIYRSRAEEVGKGLSTVLKN
jgi:hypothetical protein